MMTSTDAQADGHEEHHGGVGQYLAVFLALCVLTGASFFTCSEQWPFKNTPSIGWAFMMAVSCTKALLVILFFMHLLWEANWKYVLTIPAGMMSLFLVCMLVPDIGLRTRKYSEERKVLAAEAPVHAGQDSEHHEAGEAHGQSETHEHADSHEHSESHEGHDGDAT